LLRRIISDRTRRRASLDRSHGCAGACARRGNRWEAQHACTPLCTHRRIHLSHGRSRERCPPLDAKRVRRFWRQARLCSVRENLNARFSGVSGAVAIGVLGGRLPLHALTRQGSPGTSVALPCGRVRDVAQTPCARVPGMCHAGLGGARLPLDPMSCRRCCDLSHVRSWVNISWHRSWRGRRSGQ
jgi:hypothetical protein